MTGGEEIEVIYQRRVAPGGPRPEPPPRIDWERIRTGVDAARKLGGSHAEILRQYGALALEIAPQANAERRKIVAGQIPSTSWPQQRVLLTAVNAETGERRAFDRDSGIDLVDALIATTASFGSAPVQFEGHNYIDGGYHSSDNADLAIDCDHVLILALRSPPQAMRLVPIEAGVTALKTAGFAVEVIHPEEATMEAMAATGGQMNPASGPPAAKAGREQGQRIADQVAAFWR